MPTWEYGVLIGLGASIVTRKWNTQAPAFYRLTSQGLSLATDFKDRPTGVSEADAVASYVAQLGSDGWELSCSGPYGEAQFHVLYFKRPR